MTHPIAPYSSPNPLDAMHSRQSRSPFDLPIPLFRTAEILACLQTLGDDMTVASERSKSRRYAAESWWELAGDIVSSLPIKLVILENDNHRWVDPFEVAKRDFPPSGNPSPFRINLPLVLQHMVQAARHCVGTNQRHTDNYHGVICVQLYHHGLVTPDQCAAFHHDIIRLPMPNVCVHTGLVYPPNYSIDDAPRSYPETFNAAS